MARFNRTIYIEMSDELRNRVKRLAKAAGCSEDCVIRVFLAAYINKGKL